MNEPLSFLSAFLLGFFGSVHCMGMCGGIVGALSLNKHNSLAFHLSYHLGRISTYALLGLVVGFVGLWLSSSHATVGLVLRSMAGVLLILMGIYILGINASLLWLEKAGVSLWKIIQPLSKHLLPVNHPTQALALGLVWGFLPCGLVYSTLSWALVSANPAHSALLMVAFGLGNLPALLSFAAFTQQLNHLKQLPWVKGLMGALIICFGIWTFFAPWLGY